jgi:Ca2+-transporting ATPase
VTDEQLTAALPNLHVFGRVAPQDKLRLADLMQQNSGAVVAMTRHAVDDAAALEKADVGVLF